jgi:large subunit ribosomal protein L30e
MADIITEIKKHLKENKLVIGTEDTKKLLRKGGVTKIYLAVNCPADVKEDIKHYASLAGTEIVDLPIANDDLGGICKRPYSIAVMGLLK